MIIRCEACTTNFSYPSIRSTSTRRVLEPVSCDSCRTTKNCSGVYLLFVGVCLFAIVFWGVVSNRKAIREITPRPDSGVESPLPWRCHPSSAESGTGCRRLLSPTSTFAISLSLFVIRLVFVSLRFVFALLPPFRLVLVLILQTHLASSLLPPLHSASSPPQTHFAPSPSPSHDAPAPPPSTHFDNTSQQYEPN